MHYNSLSQQRDFFNVTMQAYNNLAWVMDVFAIKCQSQTFEVGTEGHIDQSEKHKKTQSLVAKWGNNICSFWTAPPGST